LKPASRHFQFLLICLDGLDKLIEDIKALITLQAARGERCTQHQTLQGPAPAECNIYLAMGESRFCIYDHPIKGQSLALMDSNGPGKFQRDLVECTLYVLPDLFAVFINRIFNILPFYFWRQDCVLLIRTHDHNTIIRKILHRPDFPVVVAFFRSRVILDEHHLSTHFQFQQWFSRIIVFGKYPLYFGLVENTFMVQRLQSGFIDIFGLCIMGSEYDIIFVFIHKARDESFPKGLSHTRTRLFVPDLIQQIDEILVLLPVYMLQRNSCIF